MKTKQLEIKVKRAATGAMVGLHFLWNGVMVDVTLVFPGKSTVNERVALSVAEQIARIEARDRFL